MSADDDATHECGGQRFVPVEHHRDAHSKIVMLVKERDRLVKELEEAKKLKEVYETLAHHPETQTEFGLRLLRDEWKQAAEVAEKERDPLHRQIEQAEQNVAEQAKTIEALLGSGEPEYDYDFRCGGRAAIREGEIDKHAPDCAWEKARAKLKEVGK